MTRRREPPRTNNLDALRLLAALQVALFHGWEHLRPPGPLLGTFIGAIRHVPGVPVFFVLSGFLIPWAWTRAPQPRQYARNRFLRMFPAMWVAFLGSIVVMATQGVITLASLTKPSMLGWIAAQLSFGQFYTAPELRSYGLGNPNGSLWTIVVELQFYLLVPFVLTLAKGTRRRANAVIAVLFVASLIANVQIARIAHAGTLGKLLGVTLAPFLFYFLIGTFAWNNWDKLERFVVGKGRFFALAFVLYSAVFGELLAFYSPSYWLASPFGLMAIVLLGMTTLAVGFSGEGLSAKVLAGNDLSYGVYLYHCIVLNVLIEHRWKSMGALAFLLASTLVVAGISWICVERPALSRKRRSSGPLPDTAAAVPAVPEPVTEPVTEPAASGGR